MAGVENTFVVDETISQPSCFLSIVLIISAYTACYVKHFALVVSRCSRLSRSPAYVHLLTVLACEVKHFSEVATETQPTTWDAA